MLARLPGVCLDGCENGWSVGFVAPPPRRRYASSDTCSANHRRMRIAARDGMRGGEKDLHAEFSRRHDHHHHWRGDGGRQPAARSAATAVERGLEVIAEVLLRDAAEMLAEK